MTQPDPQQNPAVSAGVPGTFIPATAPTPAAAATAGNVAAPPDPVHRATGDHEEVYYAGSPLVRGSFGRVFLHGLLGIFIIALIFLIPKAFPTFPMTWWLSMSLVIIGLVVLLVPIIAVKRLRYRISNYRIDFESGLLSKNIDTLELWHVEDIKFHQSLIDRMLGVGTISVISHDDTTPKLILHSIPQSPGVVRDTETKSDRG